MRESEKIVGDTLRNMEENELIFWEYRAEQQIRGNYRTPAPIDYFVWINPDERCIPIEVKEIDGISIPYGNWKERQRFLLNKIPTSVVVLRFFTNDLTRNSHHYFEYYWVCPGFIVPEVDEKGGGVKLSDMWELDYCYLVASLCHGKEEGFDESYGLSTRGNSTKGLNNAKLGNAITEASKWESSDDK